MKELFLLCTLILRYLVTGDTSGHVHLSTVLTVSRTGQNRLLRSLFCNMTSNFSNLSKTYKHIDRLFLFKSNLTSCMGENVYIIWNFLNLFLVVCVFLIIVINLLSFCYCLCKSFYRFKRILSFTSFFCEHEYIGT